MEDTELPKQTRIEKIRALLAKGRLEDALELFEDTFLADEALGLQARLSAWEKRQNEGIEHSDDQLVEKNRLIKAGTALAVRLEKGEKKPRKKLGQWLQENFKLVGAGIVSLAAVFTALGVILNFFGEWWPQPSDVNCVDINSLYAYQIGIGYFQPPANNDQGFTQLLNTNLGNRSSLSGGVLIDGDREVRRDPQPG